MFMDVAKSIYLLLVCDASTDIFSDVPTVNDILTYFKTT